MSENTIAANGEHTENGTPRTATALTPFLAVRDARGAVRFYTEALGARQLYAVEMPGEGGEPVVSHATLDFGGRGRLEVGEAMAAFGTVPLPDGDAASFSMALYVPDVDAVVARAAAGGAIVREEPQDFVSGDRFASIRDPYGVRWSIMTRIEDLSDEESADRVLNWAASYAEESANVG